MGFTSNKELAENKLILLYMINKLNMPVSNTHITKVILENKFMNYFLLQQFLNELCESNFVELFKDDDISIYKITSNGQQTLTYFQHLIPMGIKTIIDGTISQLKKDIKRESLITANYFSEIENEYSVECKISEDTFPLIDIKLTVGSKNDARIICDNWKQYSDKIYSEIIELLIKNRDPQ